MDKMMIKESKIKGVFEIGLEKRVDNRGFFMRTYDEGIFEMNRLNTRWVQENHSYSKYKGTVRGLHFQFPPYSETKMVRVVSGKVYMVFVDLRKNSETFGKWDSAILSENNSNMLYIPKGFALGMCTLADNSTLLYKMGNYYHPENQGVIKWNDRDLRIKWPVKKAILSERDSNAQSFKEFIKNHGWLTE
jgi:dTDP-4-dehydrorhamnose 3,5-epimerase